MAILQLRLQRINRSRFMAGMGGLLIVALMGIAVIIYANPIDITAGIRPIMRSVMALFGLKYYIAGSFICLSLIFSCLYLCRMMDRGISPWLSLLPLLLFYSSFGYFCYHFLLILQETNFLQFFAKAKRFFEMPSLANFQPLFSEQWRNFLDEKKLYLDITIIVGFFLLLTGIVVPGTKGANRYGLPKAVKVWQALIASITLLLLLSIIYAGIQLLLLDTPSQYFRDYTQFLHLLNFKQGL